MALNKLLNFKIKQEILVFLAIISPLILGILIWRYSVNVPFWDQWDTPGQLIVEASQSQLTVEQWMRQHNESRTLFPNLIFLTLANLTNWNTRSEMLVTFLLACLVSVNIYRLSKITIHNSWQHLICFVLANLLIFSPIQHENWLWGFQGITFVSIAAITTSFVIIYSSIPWVIKLIVSSVLSAIATFSFANGVLCWIIIFPALLLKSIQDKVKKSWVIFFWLIAGSMTLTIYLYDYHRPANLPSVTQIFTRPVLAISYYSALLGSPLFPEDLLASQITGLVAIFIFASFCFHLLVRLRNLQTVNKSCPWILIGFYTLFSAGLTTAGRMSIGIETSLSSRYITFATYLIISFIYLFAIVSTQIGRKIWFKIIVILLTTLFIITYKNNFLEGVDLITKSYYQRVYGKTCLLTIDLIGDRECISQRIYPLPDKLEKKARQINKIGLLQPGLVKNINWQDSKQKLRGNSTNQYGEFDNFSLDEDGSYLASGWIYASPYKPSLDTVILAYQVFDRPRKAFAIAALYPETDDLFALAIAPQNIKLTWNKTISTLNLPQGATITAWAFDTDDAKAYPLQGIADLVFLGSIDFYAKTNNTKSKKEQ